MRSMRLAGPAITDNRQLASDAHPLTRRELCGLGRARSAPLNFYREALRASAHMQQSFPAYASPLFYLT